MEILRRQLEMHAVCLSRENSEWNIDIREILVYVDKLLYKTSDIMISGDIVWEMRTEDNSLKNSYIQEIRGKKRSWKMS